MQPTQVLLLVEDNEDDAILMKRAVRNSGLKAEVQLLTDGQKAIEYLDGRNGYADRQTFPFPTLVLLDLKLPKVSGFEVLAWIRSQPELRMLIVIVLTSSNQPSDITRAYELGANSYVLKPPQFQQLLELCRALDRYWLGFNRIASETARLTYR